MEYKNGLSENEWFIMQVIWDEPKSTLREICDSLSEKKGWTKHAVTSFLKRMETKGAIRVDESDKVKRYEAVWNRDDVIQKETKSVLDRVYNGDLLLLISNAVKQKELSDGELKHLKDLIDQL